MATAAVSLRDDFLALRSVELEQLIIAGDDELSALIAFGVLRERRRQDFPLEDRICDGCGRRLDFEACPNTAGEMLHPLCLDCCEEDH